MYVISLKHFVRTSNAFHFQVALKLLFCGKDCKFLFQKEKGLKHVWISIYTSYSIFSDDINSISIHFNVFSKIRLGCVSTFFYVKP